MRIRLSAVVVVVLSMLCTQAAVWGQQSRSLFGGGSTLGRSVTGGSRSFAGGTGQMQQAATGAAGEVQTALQQITSEFVSAGARFSRESRQPGQFVGADTAEMQTFVGSVQAGQGVPGQSGSGLRSGSGLMGGGQNRRGTANRSGAARGGRRSTTQIRSSLSVGFRRPVAAPSAVSTALVRRLSRSRRVRTVSPVEVVIQGQTATLRGVVATDYDRALAGQLARLEVGIWQVRNELEVAAAPAEPEVPPPSEPVLEPPPPPPGTP
ncbi:MAG: BON domain-containing protein [Planctomycetota bacterium]|jgi:hypothetical protein